VGRDRSGGGWRCCACGLLVVGSCPGSAAANRVSQRTGAGACGERDDTKVQCDGSDERRRVARALFCWCSNDGAVLGTGCGFFSLRHGVMTVQLLSTSIFDLSQTYVGGH